MFDPVRICEILNEEGVEYVLIGGLASVVHGSSLPTQDIDLVPARYAQNLERLARSLRRMNAMIRTSDGPVPAPIDARFLANMPVMLNLATDLGDLDLTFTPAGGLGGFEEWSARALQVQIAADVSVLVAALDDIIDSKRAANRPKDRMALPYLESLRDELRNPVKRSPEGLRRPTPAVSDPARPLAGQLGRATLTLRPSTVEDLPALRAWALDPDVIAATGGGPDDEWIAELAGGLRASCEALIAEIDGRAIGVLQLAACGVGDEGYWDAIAPPGAWAIDIWIGSAEQRGHGYGTEMMRQAADRCFTVHGASELWIDPLVSNTRAIRFYQRLGWEYLAEHRFGGDGDELCAIHRLARPAVG